MRNILIITTLAIALLATSCQQYHDENRQEELAEIGMSTTKSLKDVYKSLKDNEYFYEVSNKELDILTSADSTISENANPQKLVNYKITFDLTESMYKVYFAYKALTQPRADADESGIRKAIRDFCSKIKAFELTEKAKSKIIAILNGTNNPAFKQKEIINMVSILFTEAVNGNIEENIKITENNYTAFANKLEKIPENSFELERLKKLTDEPYKDKKILVKLFKLKQKEKAQKEKTILIAKLNKASEILKKITITHSAISKQGTKDTDIDILLREIKLLIEN